MRRIENVWRPQGRHLLFMRSRKCPAVGRPMGHPLSVEAAIANVTFLTLNFDEIMANVVNMENIFRTRLENMPFENGVTIHSKGLAIAANVRDADYAERIYDKCLTKGLIIDTRKEWLTFFPALNIDEKTVTEGLDILEKCV